MSYAPEVMADASGKWAGNLLRFATEIEATWYVNDLARRWVLVHNTRVVTSEQDVNARVVANRLQHWDEQQQTWQSHDRE